MNSTPHPRLGGTGRRDSVFIVAGIVWVVIYWIALFFLKNPETSGALKVAMVLSPAIPFTFFLIRFIGHVRSLDELHRRVHLEALALAFPIATLFLMTLGLIEKAGALSPNIGATRMCGITCRSSTSLPWRSPGAAIDDEPVAGVAR